MLEAMWGIRAQGDGSMCTFEPTRRPKALTGFLIIGLRRRDWALGRSVAIHHSWSVMAVDLIVQVRRRYDGHGGGARVRYCRRDPPRSLPPGGKFRAPGRFQKPLFLSLGPGAGRPPAAPSGRGRMSLPGLGAGPDFNSGGISSTCTRDQDSPGGVAGVEPE